MSDSAETPVPGVERQPEQSRYIAALDGQVIAFAAYRDRGAQRVFTSTVTNPAYGGRGYAGLLMEAALQDAADEGRTVVPQCSYVAHYLTKHPEWQERLSIA